MTQPKHYQNFWIRKLSRAECLAGEVELKLDPYRICDVLDIGGGAREQIVKKGLRWTSKGCCEVEVLAEIMQCCERRLEMIAEDTPE